MDASPHDERLVEWTAGKPIAVPIASIEKELAALWRSVALEAESRRAAVTRACAWNLIVRVPSDPELVRAKRIIDQIAGSVPARVLVMATHAGGPATPITATVEANWQGGAGGVTQIGSEEVTLVARGAAIDDLPQLTRALTVPDVPIAALWLGAGPTWRSALDRELCAAADRLILDGDATPNAGEARAFLERRRRGADATDLAWLGGARARSLLAALFDPPSPPDDVRTLSRIEIVCRPDRAGSASRLEGWLRSRLPGQPQITVRADAGARDPFGSIALDSAGGHYALTFQEGAVVLRTPTLEWQEPLRPHDDGALWIAALGPAGRDPLYLVTMPRIEALFEVPLVPGT